VTGTLTAEEELHWLALTMVPGLGTRKASQLIERYRTPEAVFRASSSELEGFGLSGSIARSIAGGCAFEDAVDQQQKAREQGVAVIPIADARYPPRLREIYDPPVVLFARGRMELLQSAMLGVVGTRRSCRRRCGGNWPGGAVNVFCRVWMATTVLPRTERRAR
jgi:DNA processing protein